MADEHWLVMCTCPGDTVAAEVATALIEQNLAACVNRLPGVKSWYRWQGRFESEDEVLLLIKTVRSRYEALQSTIIRLHPYEVPEIIAIPIAAGSAAYLGWISESTR